MSEQQQQQQSQEGKTISAEDFQKMEDRAKRFEAQLADYEKKFKGIDIEALKAKAAEADLLKRDAALGDKDKIEQLIKDKEIEIRKALENEFNDLKSNNEKLSTRNRELEVVDKVFGAIASRFNDDCHEDVKARIRANADRAEDGKIIFKDEEGKKLYSKTKPSQELSIEEFAETLAEQKPSWAKSKAVGGAKSGVFKSESTNTSAVTLEQYAKMSQAERLQVPAKLRQQYATQILKSIK